MLVLRLIAVVCVWLTVPACWFLSSKDSPPAAPARADISVEVENHNWSDVTIYLLAGGLPQRLGMVTSMRTATFAFPSLRLNSGSGLRLRALPVAGHAFTTESILVQPGQAIFWRLENDLDTSSYTVY